MKFVLVLNIKIGVLDCGWNFLLNFEFFCVKNTHAQVVALLGTC